MIRYSVLIPVMIPIVMMPMMPAMPLIFVRIPIVAVAPGVM